VIDYNNLQILEIEFQNVELGGSMKKLCFFRDRSSNVKSILELQEIYSANSASLKLEEE
jgi:hypothetical protein